MDGRGGKRNELALASDGHGAGLRVEGGAPASTLVGTDERLVGAQLVSGDELSEGRGGSSAGSGRGCAVPLRCCGLGGSDGALRLAARRGSSSSPQLGLRGGAQDSPAAVGVEG